MVCDDILARLVVCYALCSRPNYTVGLGFDIILNIVHGGQLQWHILGERGLQPPEN